MPSVLRSHFIKRLKRAVCCFPLNDDHDVCGSGYTLRDRWTAAASSSADGLGFVGREASRKRAEQEQNGAEQEDQQRYSVHSRRRERDGRGSDRDECKHQTCRLECGESALVAPLIELLVRELGGSRRRDDRDRDSDGGRDPLLVVLARVRVHTHPCMGMAMCVHRSVYEHALLRSQQGNPGHGNHTSTDLDLQRSFPR